MNIKQSFLNRVLQLLLKKTKMNSLRGCRLTVFRKNGNCTLFKPQTNSIKIGSDISCSIRIKTSNVKALHCKIVKSEDENKISIINYCEKHPVKVNNEIVLNKAFLKNGDVLQILNVQMKWQHLKIKPREKWTDAVMTARLAVDSTNPLGKSNSKKVIFTVTVNR